MFDVSWSEILVIGIVALIVIGPRELPGVLRSLGRALAKLKTMAGEFRGQFDDAMREAELHEVNKEFTAMNEAAQSATTSAFNPIETIRSEIKGAVEAAKGEAAGAPAPDSAALQAINADAAALEAETRINAADAAPPPEPVAAERLTVKSARKRKSENIDGGAA